MIIMEGRHRKKENVTLDVQVRLIQEENLSETSLCV